MSRVHWIAVDWGTSTLRVWLIDAEGGVIEARRSAQGMNATPRDGFEAAFLDLVGDTLPDGGRIPVIVCGMAGARQGWAEAPYRAVPCAPPQIREATRALTLDPRLDVRILPGIKQDKPADVMRGEETQIAGIFAAKPNFDGVICLPGTHTKWVQVSAREVVSFRTFMTGEIFDLLATKSVLRHTLGSDGWDASVFAGAVADGMSRNAAFAADLFALRAEALLHKLSPEQGRTRLSGLLIGMELAGAKPYWLGMPVIIVGEGAQAAGYRAALEAQGVAVEMASAEAVTLAGLTVARSQMKKDT